MVFVYTLVVMAFGEKFNYSSNSTAIFAALAVVPLLFRVLNRYSCDNCGMEFRSDAGPEPVQVHDIGRH